MGRVVPATEVDHIVPLRQGGAPLATANVRGLCKPHHSSRTARDTGFGSKGIGGGNP
jgi:5-methylcytosine-specific restriction endonuclease McrA